MSIIRGCENGFSHPVIRHRSYVIRQWKPDRRTGSGMTGLVRVHRAIFCLRSVALQSKITFLGGSTGRYFAFGKNLGGPLRTPTHPYEFATLPASLLRRGLPRPAEPCRPVSPSPASRRASYDSTPASAGLLRLVARGLTNCFYGNKLSSGSTQLFWGTSWIWSPSW